MKGSTRCRRFDRKTSSTSTAAKGAEIVTSSLRRPSWAFRSITSSPAPKRSPNPRLRRRALRPHCAAQYEHRRHDEALAKRRLRPRTEAPHITIGTACSHATTTPTSKPSACAALIAEEVHQTPLGRRDPLPIRPAWPTTSAPTADPVSATPSDLLHGARQPAAPGSPMPCGIHRTPSDRRAAPRRALHRARLLGMCAHWQRATDWAAVTRRLLIRRGTAIMQWEVVIGLETHVQLSTHSKIFLRRAPSVRRRAQHERLLHRHGAPGSLRS